MERRPGACCEIWAKGTFCPKGLSLSLKRFKSVPYCLVHSRRLSLGQGKTTTLGVNWSHMASSRLNMPQLVLRRKSGRLQHQCTDVLQSLKVLLQRLHRQNGKMRNVTIPPELRSVTNILAI